MNDSESSVAMSITTHVDNAVMAVQLGSIMAALPTAILEHNPNGNCVVVSMPGSGATDR